MMSIILDIIFTIFSGIATLVVVNQITDK